MSKPRPRLRSTAASGTAERRSNSRLVRVGPSEVHAGDPDRLRCSVRIEETVSV